LATQIPDKIEIKVMDDDFHPADLLGKSKTLAGVKKFIAEKIIGSVDDCLGSATMPLAGWDGQRREYTQPLEGVGGSPLGEEKATVKLRFEWELERTSLSADSILAFDTVHAKSPQRRSLTPTRSTRSSSSRQGFSSRPPPLRAIKTPPRRGAVPAISQWMEHATGDGRVYWYNTTTKQSAWERPTELQADRRVAPDGASYTFAEFTNHYGVAAAAGMWAAADVRSRTFAAAQTSI
jgi:hypothetical protein